MLRDPLAEQRQAQERDENDLQVAEHRREARADVVDRLVPEREVDREHDARDQREPPLRARCVGCARATPATPRNGSA